MFGNLWAWAKIVVYGTLFGLGVCVAIFSPMRAVDYLLTLVWPDLRPVEHGTIVVICGLASVVGMAYFSVKRMTSGFLSDAAAEFKKAAKAVDPDEKCTECGDLSKFGALCLQCRIKQERRAIRQEYEDQKR